MNKKNIKRMLSVAGTVAASVIAGIVLLNVGSDNNDSDDTDYDIVSDSPKKSYKGYVPWGCQLCGGPYPLCRDGCSAFDD